MSSLHYYPYDLKLAEPFAVSANTRLHTESIFVEIKSGNKTGYGQASFPPYLKDKREDDLKFLSSIDFSNIPESFSLQQVRQYIDTISPGNMPAKAAIDMALYDLEGKQRNMPVYELLGLNYNRKIFSSYTIGMGDDSFIIRQLQCAASFNSLKIKLGGDLKRNKETVTLIRQYSSAPVGIDFNQGLLNVKDAMLMIEWLTDKNIYLVEQPLPSSMEREYEWLKINSPIEIFADESIQDINDLMKRQQQFHGVNIKLMKCGGLHNAYLMATEAQRMGMKLMLGCMTESALAVTAAAHLAPMFDYIDLDGNLSIINDEFSGLKIENGEVMLPASPGLGVKKADTIQLQEGG